MSGQLDKVEAWAKFDRTGDPKDEPYYLNGVAMEFAENVRGSGKTCDLAFGYMGGVGAWKKLSADDGLSDAEIKKRQKRWRELHPEIVHTWYALDRASKAATNEPGKVFAVSNNICFRTRRQVSVDALTVRPQARLSRCATERGGATK